MLNGIDKFISRSIHWSASPAHDEETTGTLVLGCQSRWQSHASLAVHSCTVDSSLINLAASQTLTTITCDGVDPASVTIEWTEAQIVLEESGTTMSMDELQYSTYVNEEDNGNGLTNFSRQYQVEEACFNLYVCLPDNSDLLCVNDDSGTQYQNFRLRNNNIDLTDRDVDYQSPLYKDRVAMTLLNANLPVKL